MIGLLVHEIQIPKSNMENSFFETCVDFSSMQVFYWGIFYKFLILERCSQKEATSFLI